MKPWSQEHRGRERTVGMLASELGACKGEERQHFSWWWFEEQGLGM